MKKIIRKTKYILYAILLLIIATSCSSYDTELNEMESLNMAEMSDIKKGEACTNNLFGTFKLPWFGDTAIRMSGDQSVITALKNGNIQNVYAIDKKTNSWVLYSKRCTIVFGH